MFSYAWLMRAVPNDHHSSPPSPPIIYPLVEAWPEPSTSFASEIVASQRGIEPGTSCTAGEYSMKRAIRMAVFSCHSGSNLCCYSSPPSCDGGLWLNMIRLRVEYAWRSDWMHVPAWELRITSGSPLCRGLTRAIYILCIEHLRMLRLSGESNPGPPALQASILYEKSHSNGRI